ncbi:enoyl-CoA hydratase/isomerase family protein [Microbacterium sp. C7(2022)]|uniref:enoyl-CoA hydratase/isomerase family protein n=1 Tax=Microbacterium sp. C7(2022) TaxID=2992759 RepID=UPI00237C35F4|nr:enoyl-CoA hydratase/isomerase family protein [Microbacterium sp. C7(2022)]MDE0546555.1 enoyl-CoA hydratase/isomerase family protein [Microbacterium sp. C7(2022)]
MNAGIEPTILSRSRAGVGHLTLNRPRAINALNLEMVTEMLRVLDAWEHDTDIDIVVIDGAGERGMCAGGDVRGLSEQVRGGALEGAVEFFRAEYALNARIAEYPKPIITFADGVTMGGGIGVAGHASLRIVTERSQLAMPETRIGFTPDVGGSWLLAKAPGRIGEYLALTSGVMDYSDAIYAGFADRFVPADHLAALYDAFETRADPANPAELSLLFDETPPPSRLEAAREWIDDAFSRDTVADIIARLREIGEDAASDTADVLEQLSPTALTVTLAAVRRARTLTGLRGVLEQEYGLVLWFAATQPDLVEGIRAQVIDKDRMPRWNPAALSDVPADIAEQAFAYRPVTALWG